jgi:hypothetical protein
MSLHDPFLADTHVLAPELDRVFRRVQDSVHYLPNWQMEIYTERRINPRTATFRCPMALPNVMTYSLRPSWRS